MFERFTDRARQTLTLAQSEARSLNHGFLGTEHILLGLLREGGGVGAQALQAMGITHDAVRHKVVEMVGFPTTDPSSSPPFTPRAKKVLELSLRESKQLGHSYIGTEHILLGLLREGEGVAATILVSLGADLNRVRQEVVSLLSEHRGESQPSESSHRSSGLATVRGEPCCPNCRAELATEARVRRISVPSDTGQPGTSAIDVVYCAQCRTTLQMFKPEPTS